MALETQNTNLILLLRELLTEARAQSFKAQVNRYAYFLQKLRSSSTYRLMLQRLAAAHDDYFEEQGFTPHAHAIAKQQFYGQHRFLPEDFTQFLARWISIFQKFQLAPVFTLDNLEVLFGIGPQASQDGYTQEWFLRDTKNALTLVKAVEQLISLAGSSLDQSEKNLDQLNKNQQDTLLEILSELNHDEDDKNKRYSSFSSSLAISKQSDSSSPGNSADGDGSELPTGSQQQAQPLQEPEDIQRKHQAPPSPSFFEGAKQSRAFRLEALRVQSAVLYATAAQLNISENSPDFTLLQQELRPLIGSAVVQTMEEGLGWGSGSVIERTSLFRTILRRLQHNTKYRRVVYILSITDPQERKKIDYLRASTPKKRQEAVQALDEALKTTVQDSAKEYAFFTPLLAASVEKHEELTRKQSAFETTQGMTEIPIEIDNLFSKSASRPKPIEVIHQLDEFENALRTVLQEAYIPESNIEGFLLHLQAVAIQGHHRWVTEDTENLFLDLCLSDESREIQEALLSWSNNDESQLTSSLAHYMRLVVLESYDKTGKETVFSNGFSDTYPLYQLKEAQRTNPQLLVTEKQKIAAIQKELQTTQHFQSTNKQRAAVAFFYASTVSVQEIEQDIQHAKGLEEAQTVSFTTPRLFSSPQPAQAPEKLTLTQQQQKAAETTILGRFRRGYENSSLLWALVAMAGPNSSDEEMVEALQTLIEAKKSGPHHQPSSGGSRAAHSYSENESGGESDWQWAFNTATLGWFTKKDGPLSDEEVGKYVVLMVVYVLGGPPAAEGMNAIITTTLIIDETLAENPYVGSLYSIIRPFVLGPLKHLSTLGRIAKTAFVLGTPIMVAGSVLAALAASWLPLTLLYGVSLVISSLAKLGSLLPRALSSLQSLFGGGIPGATRALGSLGSSLANGWTGLMGSIQSFGTNLSAAANAIPVNATIIFGTTSSLIGTLILWQFFTLPAFLTNRELVTGNGINSVIHLTPELPFGTQICWPTTGSITSSKIYFKTRLPHLVLSGLWGYRGPGQAIDIGYSIGPPVYNTFAGTAYLFRNITTCEDGTTCGFGNMVVVDTGSFAVVYGHLASFAENLPGGAECNANPASCATNYSVKGSTQGFLVEAGKLLGFMGTTGNSTGVHLHYELVGVSNFLNYLPLSQTDRNRYANNDGLLYGLWVSSDPGYCVTQ